MVIIYRGIVYAKMFYGGLFSGAMASPLNSSTDHEYRYSGVILRAINAKFNSALKETESWLNFHSQQPRNI